MKYIVYGGGEGFIPCVRVKDHDFALLRQLGKKEKKNVPMHLFEDMWYQAVYRSRLFFPYNYLILSHTYTQFPNSLRFGVISRFGLFVCIYWASPVCSLGVIESEKGRNIVFALVQIINFLAESGLAQLNTYEDEQPTRAMHRGVDEWDEDVAWGRSFVLLESMHAVLTAWGQYCSPMDGSNPYNWT